MKRLSPIAFALALGLAAAGCETTDGTFDDAATGETGPDSTTSEVPPPPPLP